MHVTYSCSKKSSHFVAATNTRVILPNQLTILFRWQSKVVYFSTMSSRHLTLHFCSPMKMYKLHLKEIIPNPFYFKKKCEELYLIIVLSHVLFNLSSTKQIENVLHRKCHQYIRVHYLNYSASTTLYIFVFICVFIDILIKL
jgi:hypothetical protein